MNGSGAGKVSGGVMVLRQPRGPAPEAELGAKNFGSRIRKRAIGTLLGGGARTPRDKFAFDQREIVVG